MIGKILSLLLGVLLTLTMVIGCRNNGVEIGMHSSSTESTLTDVQFGEEIFDEKTRPITSPHSAQTAQSVQPIAPTLLNGMGTSGGSTSAASVSTVTRAPLLPPTVHTLTPLSAASYYGLSKLKAMSNSGALVTTYEKLVQAVANCQADLPLDQTLTEQEFVTVFYYYRADYPQHFWCDGQIGYSVTQKTKKVASAELHYTMTGDALRQAQTKFNAAVTEILKIAATGRDEYERELLLHDTLAKHITYADGQNAHNAYGALVEGKAVCEGYARAFQYVLYQAGIQCLFAEGSGINPSTGKREGHAWNVVRIDGQYYHTDLTWDDPDDSKTPVMYPFFNMTTAQITQDHTISTEGCYALPICMATASNYHVKNGTRLTHYTVDGVAALLKGKTNGVHLYCVNGADPFVQWFHNNHKHVTMAMGMNRGYSYALFSSGNEVVVTVT